MSLIGQYAKHLFIHRLFLNCTIIWNLTEIYLDNQLRVSVFYFLSGPKSKDWSHHTVNFFLCWIWNSKLEHLSLHPPPPPEVLMGLVLIDIKFSVWCFVDHWLSCCPPSFSPFYCLTLRFTASHYPYGIFKHFLKIIFYFY